MLKFTPFPTWVVYSDDMPDDVGGYARYAKACIRPKYKGTDVGIREHEYLHVTQYWLVMISWFALVGSAMALIDHPVWQLGFALLPLGVVLHPRLYTSVPEYKLACEVAAYKEQARWYEDDRLPMFAKFIATRYGLSISADKALEALRE